MLPKPCRRHEQRQILQISQGFAPNGRLVCNSTCDGYDPTFCHDCSGDSTFSVPGCKNDTVRIGLGVIGDIRTVNCPFTCGGDSGQTVDVTCRADGTWGDIAGTCDLTGCSAFQVNPGGVTTCQMWLSPPAVVVPIGDTITKPCPNPTVCGAGSVTATWSST